MSLFIHKVSITCHNIIKAVNDISFTVNDGEILGFLGPNGAGKSTTMNIITGSFNYLSQYKKFSCEI